MLKIKKGTNEYEVIGQIAFVNDEEVEQINYTIVVDGVTTTVSSLDTDYEVFEAPDPVIEPEPIDETIPDPIPLPTAEEITRNAWLEQWHIYERANRAMKALAEAGFEPTAEEQTRFNALKNWVGQNRKPEYSQYI